MPKIYNIEEELKHKTYVTEEEKRNMINKAVSDTVEELTYPLLKMNLLLICIIGLILYGDSLITMFVDIANSLTTKPVPK